ncbi:MAG TPA: deoxyribodipyrimidine photo-lyase [Rhabdaerophilum sp.]|nr:deoxyribodipyrimidine photo-lyase [Rhabdaerophilum sp.]
MSDFSAPPRRVLHWFRNDLRLGDNPALTRAFAARECLTVFVLEENPGHRPPGGASRWWLHHSLAALEVDLQAKGGRLHFLRGNSREIIPALATAFDCDLVTWNRRYGATERETDGEIKQRLASRGIRAESFNGALLYEPMEIRSKAGGPMRVFTPFWKACRVLREPSAPLPAAKLPSSGNVAFPEAVPLAALDLLPGEPDWAGGLRANWTPGEQGARARLDAFLEGGLAGYAENRDRPDLPATSRLSPHLASGDISPRQIWNAARQMLLNGRSPASERDVEKFLAELGWREFSYHLLFHFPDLPHANFQHRFDAFPWRADINAIRAWRLGQTGYPLVDAGLRELWQTGYMHNRVRMIAASFLIKHLMQDWRTGEAWFWDTLCDADPASNAASWQWVAGSGADAAPFFRIFNPIAQGRKFDPAGDYVRRFVPEIAGLTDQYIHCPWEAPPEERAKAGIRLGETYPNPIVPHDAARERALAAFKTISAAEAEAG